jgi:hypothetical protein
VIGFPCVSLGRSTVQVADAHARVKRLVSVVRMATVLEFVLSKSSVLLCVFVWANGLNAKDIHKEMFLVYGGKCLSRKAAHSWAANVSIMTKRLKRRCGSGWDKILLCWGFRPTDKAMGQVYRGWWTICREIIFSQVSMSRFLRFISMYDLFPDPSSYIDGWAWRWSILALIYLDIYKWPSTLFLTYSR